MDANEHEDLAAENACDLCFTLALTPALSPEERGQPALLFGDSIIRPANPVAPHSKDEANVSPSSRGR
jgi:hypothetical protein